MGIKTYNPYTPLLSTEPGRRSTADYQVADVLRLIVVRHGIFYFIGGTAYARYEPDRYDNDKDYGNKTRQVFSERAQQSFQVSFHLTTLSPLWGAGPGLKQCFRFFRS